MADLEDLIGGLKQPPVPPQKDRKATSRVLVAFFFGEGLVLCCEKSVVLDFICEGGIGASEDGFTLDGAGVDYKLKPDGLYIGVLRLVDDGAGDYPGTREYMPSLADTRLATKREWRAHLAGDWPWKPS
jgi:hypothetical protein